MSTSTLKPHIITKNLFAEISGGSTLGSGTRTSCDDDDENDEEEEEGEDDGDFGSRDGSDSDDDESGQGAFGSGSSVGEGVQSTAKVQFMVTGRMRQVLTEELGYLPSEIDMIEPQIAAVVIERGLARPSAGMPASWRKTNVARAVVRRRPGSKGIPSISNIIKTLKKPIAMIPIVAVATYFMVQTGSINPLLDMKFPKLKMKKRSKKPMTKLKVLPSSSSSSGSKKKNVGVDLHSIESIQGKGYNTWLDKMR